MSAEFVNFQENDTETTAEKKKKKKSGSALEFGKAAVEEPSYERRRDDKEKPKSLFYGSEDLKDDKKEENFFSFASNKEDEEKPKLPPAEEILKAANESQEEEDDDDEEDDAELAESKEADEIVIEREGQLKEAEKPAVFKTIAEQELEKPKTAESQTEADAEDQAAEIFYENLYETGDPDAATAKTSEDLDIQPAELEDVKSETEAKASEVVETEPELEVETFEATEPETTVTETEPETTSEEPQEFDEAEVSLRQAEAEEVTSEIEPEQAAEDDEDDDNQPATTQPTATPTTAGAGGSGGVPPYVMAGYHNGPNGPGGAANPNFNARYATSGNLNEQQGHVPEYDQGNPAITALIGAIIGYRFGKRRGRRMEQKRLVPIQKKLEKEVTNLQWQVQESEKRIRRVAREKALKEGDAFLDELRTAHERYVEKSERRQMRKMEVASAPKRQRAPEANELHGANPHERIGHVLMAAEAATPIVARRPEAAPRSKEQARQVTENIGERRVETLNREELLRLSEKIVVDGTTLRQIYESRLVGERGLRRLIAEHLRGGEVKKVLRQEIIEREIDFERDPVMRDQPATGSFSGGGTSGNGKANKTQLNQLLAKAGASLPDESEQTAFYKARAAYEAAERAQQQKQKQMMDTAFVSIIAVLLAVVVYLLVR